MKVSKTQKYMSKKVRGARGKSPSIKTHDVLNFKGIKKIQFDDVNDSIFSWPNLNTVFYQNSSYLNSINSHEAYFRSQYEWDATEYFYTRANRKLPLTYRIDKSRFDKSFITDLFTFLSPPSHSLRAVENFCDKDLVLNEFTLAFCDDLVLQYDTEDLSFYIDPEKHLVENDSNPFYVLLQVIAGYKKKSNEKNKIHVVYKGDYGFDKIGFDVKKVDIDLDINYNDDFKEVSNTIIKNLNDKKKTGLYILSGIHGSGKTTYIRYLAGKLTRNIIFISPDMVNYITDPSFIPFLMDNSDSILIIEDAEPALQKRDGSARTGAISNILNMTDGLLSDCLNISIVATFNTSMSNIDEALLRDGRLVKSYVFEELAKEKSTKLLRKLGNDVEATKPMTLAEIYFYGKDNRKDTFESKKIGFVK